MATKQPSKRRETAHNGGSVTAGSAHKRRPKGDLRRELIVNAAASLLETSSLDELTYRAVCGRAGMPESSAYYFFQDLPAIYRALLARLERVHDRYCFRDLLPDQRQSWKTIVWTTLDRSAAFMRRNPVFAKLTISGRVPFELKQVDRAADRGRAQFITETISKYFVLPRVEALDDIFYIACVLCDQVSILSMIQYGTLTPAMIEHGKNAATSFIEFYIGENIAIRPERKPASLVSISR